MYRKKQYIWGLILPMVSFSHPLGALEQIPGDKETLLYKLFTFLQHRCEIRPKKKGNLTNEGEDLAKVKLYQYAAKY